MLTRYVINAVKMELYATTFDYECSGGFYTLRFQAGLYTVKIPAMQIDTMSTDAEVINLIVDVFRQQYKRLGV